KRRTIAPTRASTSMPGSCANSPISGMGSAPSTIPATSSPMTAACPTRVARCPASLAATTMIARPSATFATGSCIRRATIAERAGKWHAKQPARLLFRGIRVSMRALWLLGTPWGSGPARVSGHAGTKRLRARKPVFREKKDGLNGSIHRPGVQTLPPGGNEALLEGRALLHGKVLVHASAVPTGAARARAHQVERVRGAPPREAEGPSDLRCARAPVPRLLLRLGAHERPH